MSHLHTKLFTIAEREDLRQQIVALAIADARLTAAAEVGSRAADVSDRYSDIDLTFGVADGYEIESVVTDWTILMWEQFAAQYLVDARRGTSLYRVFLLPGLLQCDLSFTPAADFGARGPQFRLLYGETGKNLSVADPNVNELFGWAVHHALRARFCIERGHYWQAEYWLSGLRDNALTIACLQAGLPAAHGRGFDQLAPEILSSFETALPRALEQVELLRALDSAVECMLYIASADELARTALPLAEQLLALVEPFDIAE